LEIVLPYVGDNGMHDFAEVLWQIALSRAELDCLMIISQHLRPVTYQHWESLNWMDRVSWSWEPEKWKEIFRLVGKKLLANEEVEDGLSTETNTYAEKSLKSSILLLYHTKTLCVEGASCAWSLGHRNLEDERYIENDANLSGTALWINLTQGSWEATMWLLRHGADLTWVHPVLLTMPAHIIARRAFSDYFGWTYNFSRIDRATMRTSLYNILFEDGLFTRDLQDKCVCRCSRAGCRPISSAIIAFTRTPLFSWRKSYYERVQHLFTFSDVFPLVSHATDQNWIASTILRAMTFEGLLLTHTCCHKAYTKDYWDQIRSLSRSSPEEIEMIQKDEQAELDRLEDHVAEFEAGWNAYEESFESFIWKVWRPRMQAVRQGDKNRDEHIADLVDVGVKLVESDEKNNKNEDMTWMEYFLSGKEVEEEGEEDSRHYW
jgi:hypothetical protein